MGSVCGGPASGQIGVFSKGTCPRRQASPCAQRRGKRETKARGAAEGFPERLVRNSPNSLRGLGPCRPPAPCTPPPPGLSSPICTLLGKAPMASPQNPENNKTICLQIILIFLPPLLGARSLCSHSSSRLFREAWTTRALKLKTTEKKKRTRKGGRLGGC